MTLSIKWHQAAQDEFDADIDWYDDREFGLGDRFETEVLAAVGESADTPQACLCGRSGIVSRSCGPRA